MPIYEYECAHCHKVLEVMQKFSDEPLKICPECGGTVSKIMSMTSFALKGTGWYTTDYKKSGKGSVPSPASPTSAAAATPGAPASTPAAAPAAAAPASEAPPKKP